jgi:two-component system, OmpR family, sensor histidine kinase KdpD
MTVRHDEKGPRAQQPGGVRVSPMLSRLSRSPRRQAVGYGVAILGTVALTAALLPIRSDVTPLSKGFGFLAVVVVAAAVGGLWPGIAASFFGFLMFNFFFLPPYNTFIIGRGEYVVVLFVFLGLSILISALLARATERAEAAEAREEELRTLQSLSAELVAAVPGPESYTSALGLLMELFGFSAGALFVQDPVSRDLQEQATVGAPPGELSPRWDPASQASAAERLPLSVGGRILGLFVLRSERPGLSPPESRVLRAFCDQFALVLERDRLLHKATEAEVYRQTDQLRRSLLAAVSHDLRTPLASIKASVTDLLGEDADHGAEYARESLRAINQETDRLAALVANLLDMSRIEGGMLRARIQSTDMAEILTMSIDRAQRQWPTLAFRLRANGDGAVVRADPVFLDRVVTNLLDNAAKAAADSGAERVEVEVRRSADRAEVRVIDHGGGLPQPVREQLFYPFYQVTERHPRLGSGLGLPIAKGFLSLMGGDIWIEDTPGGGATLAFSLPRAATAPEDP